MAHQIRDQKPQAANLTTVTACGFSILHLIGFFLATQEHSRNNSSVHGFWIRTVNCFPLLYFSIKCDPLLFCGPVMRIVRGDSGRYKHSDVVYRVLSCCDENKLKNLLEVSNK